MVDRFLSSPNKRSTDLAPEETELERLRVLLCGADETPLKTAMMNLIDRLKSEHPDPAEVAAAMEEVKRLWPEVAPDSAEAVSVHHL